MSVKTSVKAKIVEYEPTVAEPLIEVVKAEYTDGYRIALTFADGTRRIVDFAPFLSRAQNPMATQYRDVEKFKQFEIVNGNLNWNDYEMIFPVALLYAGAI
jgi:hypothetical protein